MTLPNPQEKSPAMLYWEDFPVGWVREFGSKTMVKEEIISFAQQFDPQPFHLDEQAGLASLFGGLCASGWHTAASTMRIMCDSYLLNSASLGSPGLESLKWNKPVFPGDVLRVRMTVLESRVMNSKPHVGLLRCKHEALNQHDDVVMTMEGWSMMGRKPARD